MAEKKSTAINKMNILHGIIIRSTVDEGQIVDIQLPELDSHFLVIAARDIPGNNRIQVLDTQMPLLTSSQISYKGQPILALFGHDFESVELKAREIRISYKLPPSVEPTTIPSVVQQQEIPIMEGSGKNDGKTVDAQTETIPAPTQESGQTQQPVSPAMPDGRPVQTGTQEKPRLAADKRKVALSVPPKTLGWGDIDTVFHQEGVAVVQRSYTFRSVSSNTTSITRATAAKVEDLLHIDVPTQWPFHVRDTVSEATSVPKKKIVIHQQQYYAPCDEKLLEPSILSALAAIAANNTGFSVEIQSQQPTFSPEIQIRRKSAIDKNGKPLAEQIDVMVDQGAYPLFSSELANQLTAGLVPLYPLQAMQIRITTMSSPTAPAHFFGDLGYSKAIASTETHYSALAREAGMNPADWRFKYLGEYPQRTAQVANVRFSRLKEMLNALCERSDYQRKHATYEIQRSQKLRVSTFLNYSRGIGIACGAGISGFSGSFRQENQFSVQVILNANDRTTLNTSFPTRSSSADVWKAIVARELDVDDRDIGFIEDPIELVDSGPVVLSRNIGRLPLLFEKACDTIKAQRFIEPLPIVATISSKASGASGSQFYSDSWAALILELEIDTISLQPIIRHAWASFDFGYVHDEHALRSKVHNIIVRTLVENGAQLSKKKNNEFTMDIEISTQSKGEPISISSVLQGLVISALGDAMTQAMDAEVRYMPVSAEDVLNGIRGGEA
ncbi:MAG: molybdopterin cofactor-binding domain-containing protein [Sphaerochaetaceae bacterium]|nr:molybdopterin cofactor-binding domain-containing protein [Sphaerochaetaceae bacterium]